MEEPPQPPPGTCHIFATIDRHLASIRLPARQLAAL
jgi:hypothetical protein